MTTPRVIRGESCSASHFCKSSRHRHSLHLNISTWIVALRFSKSGKGYKEACMAKVKVAAFTVSLDGFGAGPRQDLQIR